MKLRFSAVVLACGLMWMGAGQAQYLEAIVPCGVSPLEVIWVPTVNKVYVANSQDASITVISGSSNEVIATIPVADYTGGFAWNPNGNKLYAMSGEGGLLQVIDCTSDQVIRTLPLMGYPANPVVNISMNKLYVASLDDPIYRILVLDADPDTVLRTIAVLGVGPLLWNPATNRVFSSGADSIRVIDCATDVISSRLPGGGTKWCYNPANDLVYLAGAHSVAAISPDGDSVIATIPGFANYIAAIPYPNKLYIGGAGGGTRVVDCGGSHVVTDTIHGIAGPMLCETVRGRVYFAGSAASVVDARADTLIKTIPLGRSPEVPCWNRTNSRVYIPDFMDNVVYVIRDTSTAVGEPPGDAALSRWPGATVTRCAFFWPRHERGALLDMCGRVVARLRPGHNDLRALAPGVYAAVVDGRSRMKVVKTK